jgi:subtilisin family serine protease
MKWGETFRRLSRTYSKCFQPMSEEPIKVAILDSGIDLNHPDFKHPRSKLKKDGNISPAKGEQTQVNRIRAWRNFCIDRTDARGGMDFEDVTDMDGHGTHVAGIILQLAPCAELYIARVCEGDESYGRCSKAPQPHVPNNKSNHASDAKNVSPQGVEDVRIVPVILIRLVPDRQRITVIHYFP